jgi:hypothetical protein
MKNKEKDSYKQEPGRPADALKFPSEKKSGPKRLTKSLNPKKPNKKASKKIT